MESSKKEEMDAKWKVIATQAVTKEEYRRRLTNDPLEVMKENGLEPPNETKINISADRIITLILPEEASEELKEEVTWWHWRFKAINEFGREIKTGVQEIMPETEEGI